MDGAGVGLIEKAEKVEEGAFAAAGGAYDGIDFTSGDFEGEGFENLYAVFLIAEVAHQIFAGDGNVRWAAVWGNHGKELSLRKERGMSSKRGLIFPREEWFTGSGFDRMRVDGAGAEDEVGGKLVGVEIVRFKRLPVLEVMVCSRPLKGDGGRFEPIDLFHCEKGVPGMVVDLDDGVAEVGPWCEPQLWAGLLFHTYSSVTPKDAAPEVLVPARVERTISINLANGNGLGSAAEMPYSE